MERIHTLLPAYTIKLILFINRRRTFHQMQLINLDSKYPLKEMLEKIGETEIF